MLALEEAGPLAVGYSNEENYLGSDSYALKSMTNKISYLDDGELCMLTKNNVAFYDVNLKKINKKIHIVSDDENISDKGDYKNFMSKEIFEQASTIKKCLNEYTDSIKKDINLSLIHI